MNEKIVFPKAEEVLEASDLGILDAPGVVFKFWKNPSKQVVTTIGRVVMASPEELLNLPKSELRELEVQYYRAISQLIIECNIESLKFDTPEDALAAFESPELPIGFLYEVIVGYLAHLYQFNEKVKKALALFWVGSASGKNGAKKEKQSINESGQTPS